MNAFTGISSCGYRAVAGLAVALAKVGGGGGRSGGADLSPAWATRAGVAPARSARGEAPPVIRWKQQDARLRGTRRRRPSRHVPRTPCGRSDAAGPGGECRERLPAYNTRHRHSRLGQRSPIANSNYQHTPGTLARLDRYLHDRTGGMIGALSTRSAVPPLTQSSPAPKRSHVRPSLPFLWTSLRRRRFRCAGRSTPSSAATGATTQLAVGVCPPAVGGLRARRSERPPDIVTAYERKGRGASSGTVWTGPPRPMAPAPFPSPSAPRSATSSSSTKAPPKPSPPSWPSPSAPSSGT